MSAPAPGRAPTVVVDGAVDLPDDVDGVTAPVIVRVPGSVWADGRPFDGDVQGLWARLRSGVRLSTQPPTVEALTDAYRAHRPVCSVHVGAGFSATMARAEEAASRLGWGVDIVDSGSLSVGAGLVALVARDAASTGGDPAAVARDAVARLHTFVLVDDPGSLRRSDRAGLLPEGRLRRGRHRMLLAVRHRVVALDDVRTRDEGVAALAGHAHHPPTAGPATWALGHGDASDAARAVERIATRLGSPPRFVSPIDGTVGVHVGAEALIVGVLAAAH